MKAARKTWSPEGKYMRTSASEYGSKYTSFDGLVSTGIVFINVPSIQKPSVTGWESALRSPGMPKRIT